MEVAIERILPGGLGLAHADGQTVMVALTAPGDRVRIRIDRMKGNVVFASIEEIIEASPQRVEPPCPYFGRCGGCDFQQMSYEAQLAAKKEILRDCLRRIARLDNIPDFEIVRAPNEWHYRARAQWQYDAPAKRLGYFESASRRVCDVAECAVLVPELQSALEGLRARMAEQTLPPEVRYFRAMAGDDEVSVAPPAPRRVRNPTLREGTVRDVRRTIGNETYTLDAASFFQTNADLLPHLIDEAIGAEHGDTAVELYCGVGLFTIPLARRFKEVIGVEGDADATEFARKNLANARLDNAEVIKSDVAEWLSETPANDNDRKRRQWHPARRARMVIPPATALQNADFLLLDPPRSGAESRVIDGILQLMPKRICYVSCDPATLARDLRKIIAGEYSLDSLAAFDMFPQTHHLETVVHLSSG